jgi:hypothetical protein
MDDKQEIMDRISQKLGISKFYTSTGSTEPLEFLLEIAIQLGIRGLLEKETKVMIAKAIVESAGRQWLPSFESRGATITKQGLLEIERTVNNYLK